MLVSSSCVINLCVFLASGEDILEDDDYFTCITKAFETIGTAAKRRAYDSVDPFFADEVPDVIKDNSKDFLKTFTQVKKLEN